MKLPSDLIRDCKDFGHRIVEVLRSGGDELSHQFSSHGADLDPVLQAEAKAAECIFALELGLDPRFVVGWECSRGKYNSHYDVRSPRGTRVDVKNTRPHGIYLIWPVRKVPLFQKKQFDVFVLTKVSAEFEGYSHGCITKAAFWRDKQIADEAHVLTTGTPYLHQDKLRPMHAFEGYRALRDITPDQTVGLSDRPQIG